MQVLFPVYIKLLCLSGFRTVTISSLLLSTKSSDFFSDYLTNSLLVAKENLLYIYRLTTLQAANYSVFHKPFRTVLGCLKDIPRVINSGLDL